MLRCQHLFVIFVLDLVGSTINTGLYGHLNSAAPCDHKIFCDKSILEKVARDITNHSKVFVDSQIKNDSILQFPNISAILFKDKNNDINHYLQPHKLESCNIEKKSPSFLPDIKNQHMRDFAENLIQNWPSLCKKVGQDVKANPILYSLISVDEDFIIPGGPLQEWHYWDSYFIMKGLLVSEQYALVEGMLNLIAKMIKKFGFVPKGGRIYYLHRSGPPLFSRMVRDYLKIRNETAETTKQFWIDAIEQELYFWNTYRMEEAFRMYKYKTVTTMPRPEFFKFDTKKSNIRLDHYQQVNSASESTWDLSSRWVDAFCHVEGPRVTTHSTSTSTERERQTTKESPGLSSEERLITMDIIPVDLNAYVCGLKRDLYLLTHKSEHKADYESMAKNVKRFFWDEHQGTWFDYHRMTGQRKTFFISNLVPLWTQCFDESEAKTYGGRVAEYLMDNGFYVYVAGLPLSFLNSRFKWDYPNSWPPMESILINGLADSGDPEAAELAKILAKQTVLATYASYRQKRELYEMYDSRKPGEHGLTGGGKGPLGTTNGVMLDLIQRFFGKNAE